jgi:nucleotide-binding universal stress UspA family protein
VDNLRTILVPTDFSETSDLAVQAALSLAQKYGAEVVLTHVYAIPIYSFPDGAYISPANLATDISNAAQKGLDALVQRISPQGIKIRALLREGNADEEIRNLVHELPADLVVVGTHARRGLARALLGSVAETVIRTVDVPVLVIHPPPKPH